MCVQCGNAIVVYYEQTFTSILKVRYLWAEQGWGKKNLGRRWRMFLGNGGRWGSWEKQWLLQLPILTFVKKHSVIMVPNSILWSKKLLKVKNFLKFWWCNFDSSRLNAIRSQVHFRYFAGKAILYSYFLCISLFLTSYFLHKNINNFLLRLA